MMKSKKTIITAVLAALMMVGSSLPVFAAETSVPDTSEAPAVSDTQKDGTQKHKKFAEFLENATDEEKAAFFAQHKRDKGTQQDGQTTDSEQTESNFRKGKKRHGKLSELPEDATDEEKAAFFAQHKRDKGTRQDGQTTDSEQTESAFRKGKKSSKSTDTEQESVTQA